METAYTPLTEIVRGLNAYVRGLQWLKQRPSYLALLFLPMTLTFVLFALALRAFIFNRDSILDLFFSVQDWNGWLYWTVLLIVSVFAFAILLFFSVVLLNIVSSPVYEIVSAAVERQIHPGAQHDIGFLQSLSLIKEELKKVTFILLVSITFLFVPVLNVFSPVVTGFLLGWEFYDFSFARRGWTFRQRLGFVIKRPWAILGFGFWMMIPWVQFLLMPLAVVGGTLLALEDLQGSEQNNLRLRT